MLKHEAADLFSLLNPVLNCRPKVNARIDSGFTVLCPCLRKAGVRPRYPSKRGTAGSCERDLIVMEEIAQYVGNGTTQDTVSRGIVWNRGSIQQRRPNRVDFGRRISIRISGGDGGYRTSEVVCVLPLHSSDETICHCQIH